MHRYQFGIDLFDIHFLSNENLTSFFSLHIKLFHSKSFQDLIPLECRHFAYIPLLGNATQIFKQAGDVFESMVTPLLSNEASQQNAKIPKVLDQKT